MSKILNKTLIFCVASLVALVMLSVSSSGIYASANVSVNQATYKPLPEIIMKNMKIVPDLNSVSTLASTDTYKASEGFSSQQGLNQWYYQQWNGTSYSNMTWDATNGRWKGTAVYTLVMSNAQHADAQDSVRKWLSPKTGTIRITGTVKKGDPSTGDGVLVKVMKNQEQLWPASGWQSIKYNDNVGYSLNLTTSVGTGDGIYFIVNKNVTTYADTTAWDPVITYESVTPMYSYEYNEAGRLYKMTDPNGRVFVFSYDKNGNLLKKVLQP